MNFRDIPVWFTLIVIVNALGGLCLMLPAARVLDSAYGLDMGWLEPVFVVLASICAWVCYPSRRALAWILEALVLLQSIMLLIVEFTAR